MPPLILSLINKNADLLAGSDSVRNDIKEAINKFLSIATLEVPERTIDHIKTLQCIHREYELASYSHINTIVPLTKFSLPIHIKKDGYDFSLRKVFFDVCKHAVEVVVYLDINSNPLMNCADGTIIIRQKVELQNNI